MDPREGELEQPDEEKAEKLLGGDVGGGGEGIGPVGVGRSEDAAEHDGQKIAAVVRLDTVPDNADAGTDEDEEVTAPHPHNGPYQHRAKEEKKDLC